MRTITRAQLLRGDLSGEHPVVRPPWSVVESEFQARCTGCGECADACPEGILVAGRARLPAVDFRRGACNFCGACAEACREGAIGRNGQSPWKWVAAVAPRCLAFGKVVCRSCSDACETRALRFVLQAGGPGTPAVDEASCTGCGACVAVCPPNAIHIKRADFARRALEREAA